MTSQETTSDGYHYGEAQPLLSDHPLPPEIGEVASSDENTDSRKDPNASRKVFLKISFLLLGDYLANADEFFLLAAYEKIASEFLKSGSAAWIVLAESLVYMISLPIHGFLSDRYGSKVPIIGSYIIFIVACLITSVGNTFWMVVGGRMVCGVANAGLFTLTSIVIVDNAEPSDVGILRSYANVFTALGRNTGPIIGGLLTDAIGWRRAFLCELPVAAICLVVVGIFFDSGNHKKETAGKDRDSTTQSNPNQDRSADIPGVLLFNAAILAFLVAILQIGNRISEVKIVLGCSIAMSIILCFILVLRNRSIGTRAFVPLYIFKDRLGFQFLIQFCWMFVLFSSIVILPVYFARETNATPSGIALHLLPMTITNLAGNLLAGRLMKIWKRYKLLMHIAMFINAIGLLLIALRWRGYVSFGESLYVSMLGIGTGIYGSSSFVAVSTDIEESRKGSMIGFFFLAGEIGGWIGMRISSTIVNLVLKQALMEKGPNVPDRSKIIKGILDDSSFAFTLSERWQRLAAAAFLKGFRPLFLAFGAIAVVMQPLILLIKEKVLE